MSQLTLRTSKTCAASIGGAAKSVCGRGGRRNPLPFAKTAKDGAHGRAKSKARSENAKQIPRRVAPRDDIGRGGAGSAEVKSTQKAKTKKQNSHPSQRTRRMGHTEGRKAKLEAKTQNRSLVAWLLGMTWDEGTQGR